MGHDHDHGFDFSGVILGYGHDVHGGATSDHDEDLGAWLQDNVELITVGVDVGSSTSHLVFSKLHLQRLAQSLSSRFVVVERNELYRSPILLTPFTDEATIDIDELSCFIDESYRQANVTPGDIDTGVVILTGVALERRNSRAVADLFAAQSGKFVCASAGHNLEGILAAHGSGAVSLSRRTGCEVLHIDIGGGTSKLALISAGEVLETCAISVGARLIAFDDHDRPVRIESAAGEFARHLHINLDPGSPLADSDKSLLAREQALTLARGALLESTTELTDRLLLTAPLSRKPAGDFLVTFSGGVSEYLFGRETQVFGDLAMHLAREIKADFGRRGLKVTQPAEGIRATAIGASQFTVQLSGSTIYVSHPELLPLHNLPVVRPKIADVVGSADLADGIRYALSRLDITRLDSPVCVYLPWQGDPHYSSLRAIASGVFDAMEPLVHKGNLPLILALEADIGAALGRLLRDELGLEAAIIAIDGVELRELDFIDLGKPLQPTGVLPVMVKSLAFPVQG